MLLIDNKDNTDPTINLALEEYCVRNLNMDNDSLLLYINEPSVIIGKHQNTIEEINTDYIEEKGIHVVRRISGGGAVYHDKGNLNFSFMTKHSQRSIHNFRYFTQPVINVLKDLGIVAELNGRNDITINDKKISGNAQFTDTKSMFSHGTLLFDSNIDDVFKSLNVKSEKIESKSIKSVKSRVANIKDFIKHDMTIEEFRGKIISSVFGESFPGAIFSLSEFQWKQVADLSQKKYKNWDWNYGRSPEFNVQKIRRFPFGQIDVRINVKDGVIESVKIYGDFLGHGDPGEIESKLVNVKYERNNILRALNNLNLMFYFGEIDAEQFTDFILN